MTELQDLAHKLRIHSVNMTTASKSGHPTSCSSMAEVGTMTMLSHFTTVQFLGDVRALLQSDALLCGGAKTCGQWPFHPLQRPCRTHLVCSLGGGKSHSLKSYFLSNWIRLVFSLPRSSWTFAKLTPTWRDILPQGKCKTILARKVSPFSHFLLAESLSLLTSCTIWQTMGTQHPQLKRLHQVELHWCGHWIFGTGTQCRLRHGLCCQTFRQGAVKLARDVSHFAS